MFFLFIWIVSMTNTGKGNPMYGRRCVLSPRFGIFHTDAAIAKNVRYAYLGVKIFCICLDQLA